MTTKMPHPDQAATDLHCKRAMHIVSFVAMQRRVPALTLVVPSQIPSSAQQKGRLYVLSSDRELTVNTKTQKHLLGPHNLVCSALTENAETQKALPGPHNLTKVLAGMRMDFFNMSIGRPGAINESSPMNFNRMR